MAKSTTDAGVIAHTEARKWYEAQIVEAEAENVEREEAAVRAAETTATPATTEQVTGITKNISSVKFARAPFYSLANVRKSVLALIVRSSSDPEKVATIRETLEVLLAFLEVRAEHGAKVLNDTVKAEAARDAERASKAASWREADAVALLKDGEANVSRAKGILAKLRG